jgi:hypothetical protein
VQIAQWIVNIVLAYGTLGVLFAMAFVLRGAQVVDPGAKGAHWGFRALIFPGAAALWPVMLSKWARAATGPGRREHQP